LLKRARRGTPIIDGHTATFVWRGKEAPQLIGDWTDWEWGSPATMEQVTPDVWSYKLTLPEDAYIEYAFWQDGERVADPFSLHTSPDGLGHKVHYFYMPGAAPTPLTHRRRDVPHGTVTRHAVEQEFLLAGRKRTVYLYQPPGDGVCLLLVVLDGQDYRRRGKLVNIVDNLIAEGRIQPAALAMVNHAGSARGVEYACSEAHVGFLLTQVLPLAQRNLNLLDVEANPGAFGIMGASMGGLMALYTGLRAPYTFGRVLCQSSGFTMDVHDTVVFDLVRYGPVRPLKIWMDVGRYEWLLDCNRRMHDLLVAKGYDVIYREHNGGHNYPSWRNDLWHGLETLFAIEGDRPAIRPPPKER
jgi:enterochelin esterase family protein